MYRVYVLKQRKKGSEVIADTKTQTSTFGVAEAAFKSLMSDDYDKNHLLLMTKNNKQINAYRYKSTEGDQDYLTTEDTLND